MYFTHDDLFFILEMLPFWQTELKDPLFEVCPQAGSIQSNSTVSPTAVPVQFTPTPPTIKSTKAPSQIRSTKAPSPLRSTKAPEPAAPTHPSVPTPVTPTSAPRHPETQKPSCDQHSNNSSSSSKAGGGKGKGNAKKSKGSKTSKSKSTKSSKGKKSKRSDHSTYEHDDENYGNNIFDHRGCGSSKTGRNSEDQNIPAPSEIPVTTPVAGPVAKSSGDWSWDEGPRPSVDMESHSSTPTLKDVPTITTPSDSVDETAPKYPTQNLYGDMEDRASVSAQTEQTEQATSKSGIDAAFGSSATMYGVLTGGVVVAIVAILVWKRPDPAFMCSKCSSAGAAEKDNMVIALVKGMNA